MNLQILIIFFKKVTTGTSRRCGFFGTYTKFTWHKNQSIRSTVKVYCDGKPVAEKIKFQQPLAVDGSFSFINRSAMCPFIVEYIQEMSQNSRANKQLSFIIQILDSTAQQTLLIVAVILCNSTTKKYLFPDAPRSFIPEPQAISYTPSIMNSPKQSHSIIPSLTTIRGSEISFDDTPKNYNNPPHFPNGNGMHNSRFSRYETYRDDSVDTTPQNLQNSGFMFSN